VEGTGFLRAAPRVGEEVPLEGTASGKLYLAFAPERVSAVQAAAAEDSAARAEGRAPGRDRARDSVAQRRALERVRAQGWASNHDEWIPGLSVIGAPIVESGRVHGVVAIAVATAQLAARGEDVLVPRVLDAARRVALRMEGKES
jgi:DNA-binding IclR family transcriptional regulator